MVDLGGADLVSEREGVVLHPRAATNVAQYHDYRALPPLRRLRHRRRRQPTDNYGTGEGHGCTHAQPIKLGFGCSV